jgi:DNA-binding winged helix-turn-helix (wHTH) protein
VRIDFDPFTLDLDTRQLTLEGREIHLAPKALELLATLVLERPRVVPKASLQERLWPGAFVVEANLSNLVAEIREALGDSARAPRFVRTVHGFGYAFSARGTTQPGEGEEATAHVLCWVEAEGRRVPLATGEHVVGRDADVEIMLDSSTVSRRHARLVVTADGASLDDCGSKNGTFRGSDRVTAPTPLADGDVIRVGSLAITFHTTGGFGTTETQAEATP